MKFGSLFSGIGGFDLGFEQAGLSCSWQVEIDKDCQRVLSKHWLEVKRYEDVSTVGKLGSVDVICGGFPCQDLSVAGKRAGLAGERSGLWFEFLRIIELDRPRWIVIENVPGLLSSDEHRDFAAILRGLVECGYRLAWRVLDAQFYGVAQRRRRVFIVGSLGDGSSAEILFESESVSWNPPTRAEAGQRVADAVTTGTGKSCGPRNGNGEPLNLITGSLSAHSKEHGHAMTTQQAAESGHLVAMPIKAKANSSHDESHETYIPIAYRTAGNCGPFEQGDKTAALNTATDLNQTIIAFSSKDHGADAGEIAPTMRSQNSKDSHQNGGGQVAIAWALHSQNSCAMTGSGDAQAAFEVDQVRALDGGAGFTAGQGGNLIQQEAGPAIAFTSRGRSDGAEIETQEDLSYALRDASGGASQGKIAGNFGVRRLTPRECERLQGFPDDWTLYDANGREISDSARYRMLGNAVAVPVARWVGERIMKVRS